MRSLVCIERDDWDGTIERIKLLGGEAACGKYSNRMILISDPNSIDVFCWIGCTTRNAHISHLRGCASQIPPKLVGKQVNVRATSSSPWTPT